MYVCVWRVCVGVGVGVRVCMCVCASSAIKKSGFSTQQKLHHSAVRLACVIQPFAWHVCMYLYACVWCACVRTCMHQVSYKNLVVQPKRNRFVIQPFAWHVYMFVCMCMKIHQFFNPEKLFFYKFTLKKTNLKIRFLLCSYT